MNARRLPVHSGMIDGRPLIADLMARARLIADVRSPNIGSISELRETIYAEALKQLKEAVAIGAEIEGKQPTIDATPARVIGVRR